MFHCPTWTRPQPSLSPDPPSLITCDWRLDYTEYSLYTVVLGADTLTQATTAPLLCYRNWLETDNKKVFSVGGTDTLAARDDGRTTHAAKFVFFSLFLPYDNNNGLTGSF